MCRVGGIYFLLDNPLLYRVVIIITETFRWHPQPSSLRKSIVAAKKFDCHNSIVLDCFCGCGTHGIASIMAGATQFIGTDIEDYSFCMKKGIARQNIIEQTFFGEKTIAFNWGIDAFEAIQTIPHDILFIDPPNPYQIAGGTTISTVRDTGLSGSGLEKFWKERFSDKNWIKQKDKTIENVIKLIEMEQGRILINLFKIKSNGFDYLESFKEFNPTQIYESYYTINQNGADVEGACESQKEL